MPSVIRAAWFAVVLGACVLGGRSAAAADYAGELAAARAALAAKDTKAAWKHLKSAEALAPAEPAVHTPKAVAELWYLMGMAHFLSGTGSEDAMPMWRQALIVDNAFEWDTGLSADDPAQDLFAALRSEVRDRPPVDPKVPEATGAARVFVSGVRVKAGETVREGTHLGQISCPDGVAHGVWSDFTKPVKWFKLCPGGVDTTVVVAEAPAEDEWGDLGPAFGGDAPPAAGTAPAVATAGDAGAAPAGAPPVEIIRKKILWPALLAGVGTAAAAGAFQVVALRQAATYNDLSNPDYQTSAALDELRSKTNRNQTLVYPLLGISGGLFFAATYQW